MRGGGGLISSECCETQRLNISQHDAARVISLLDDSVIVFLSDGSAEEAVTRVAAVSADRPPVLLLRPLETCVARRGAAVKLGPSAISSRVLALLPGL